MHTVLVMRVLLAFDKFKDSLSAGQACELTARVLRERHPGWTLDLCPLADGGEGFAEILTSSTGGKMEKFPVSGPREGTVDAAFGLVPISQIPSQACELLGLTTLASPAPTPTKVPAAQSIVFGRETDFVAVIEMSAASGLALLPQAQRDPWQTTTLGTGQLMARAAELGAAGIVLGVGGSATNDLGLGALEALGLQFCTATGECVQPPIPARWSEITEFRGSIARSIPPIRIACDVTNPLLGPRGAAAIYGPQKGMRPDDCRRLDHESARLGLMLCAHFHQSDALMDVPGAGAAGGMPFGLMTALQAKLLPGFDLVSAWLDLEMRLARADLIITGEGRFDESSLSGKGPGAVVNRALQLGKSVKVFAGAVSAAAEIERAYPTLALHAITPPGQPLAEALAGAATNLTRCLQKNLWA